MVSCAHPSFGIGIYTDASSDDQERSLSTISTVDCFSKVGLIDQGVKNTENATVLFGEAEINAAYKGLVMGVALRSFYHSIFDPNIMIELNL